MAQNRWIPAADRVHILNDDGSEIGQIAGIGDDVVTVSADGRFLTSAAVFPDVVAVSDERGVPLSMERAYQFRDPALDLLESSSARRWRVFKMAYARPAWMAFRKQCDSVQIIEITVLCWLGAFP